MNLFEGIIGHEAALAYLNGVYSQGKLAHGYLFSGPAQIGKETIARRLFSAFFGISPEKLASHPDFHLIERDMNQKTGKKYAVIRVEQIRALREKLSTSAFSGKKAILIREADRLSHTAQNALLKTLEEPFGTVLFLFLTEKPDALLPTIHSRLVSLRMKGVARERICAALREKGLSEEKAHELAGLAQGKAGRAFSALIDEQWESLEAKLEDVFRFFEASFASQCKIIAQITKETPDRKELLDHLSFHELLLHDVLLCASGNLHAISCTSKSDRISGLSEKNTLAGWGKVSESLEECKRAIQENGNIGLAIEHFSLSFHL